MHRCVMNDMKYMILDMFLERKLDILALNEKSVKGQAVQKRKERD